MNATTSRSAGFTVSAGSPVFAMPSCAWAAPAALAPAPPLVARRHVDLVRVGSALCCRTA